MLVKNETIVLTEQNRDEVIKKLVEVSSERKYWLGCGTGLLNDVNQKNSSWFLGKGTFERVVHLKYTVPHSFRAIEIKHEDAVNYGSVIPEITEIDFNSTITISEYGDLLFYSPRTKMTQIFMAWSVTRNEHWLSTRFGKTSDAMQFLKEDSH